MDREKLAISESREGFLNSICLSSDWYFLCLGSKLNWVEVVIKMYVARRIEIGMAFYKWCPFDKSLEILVVYLWRAEHDTTLVFHHLPVLILYGVMVLGMFAVLNPWFPSSKSYWYVHSIVFHHLIKLGQLWIMMVLWQSRRSFK